MSRFPGTAAKVRAFHKKYDRYIFPAALLVGFIIDSFTFSQINLLTSGVLLLVYFFVIGAAIYLFHFFDKKRLESRAAELVLPWFPVVIQYVFGGIFSAFVVFYLRSAPLGASLLFVLLLVLVLIGSEVFRKKFFRLDFQIGMFFSALFLYLFFALSVLFGKVGTFPFLLSSVLSIVAIGLFLVSLWPVASKKFHRLKYTISASLLGIFLSLHTLYFFNLIPPIPLALKNIGVYHALKPLSDGGYLVTREIESSQAFFDFLRRYDSHIGNVPGTPIYVFSAIYAPETIGTRIFHEWQYFSEKSDKWITTDRIPFSISGGREGGYRGYTFKTSLLPGRWRVNIVTEKGGLVGRAVFTVESVAQPVPMKKEIL